MFVGLHTMLAMQSNTPELMITEQEGRDFTKSAQNVMRHYSVQSTQKTLDWIAFAGCTVGIYGPRFVAVRVRKGQEARAGASGVIYTETRPWQAGDPPAEVTNIETARQRIDPLRRRPTRAVATPGESAAPGASPQSTYAPSVPSGPDHEEDN